MTETIKILNYRGISMVLSGSPNVIRKNQKRTIKFETKSGLNKSKND